MTQWKQRLYAFLLKKLLGPLLDEASLEKLHHLLEISLQDGRFALTHVHLNPHAINSRLDGRSKYSSTRVRSARLERLDIQFSILEVESARRSSWPWRTMQLIQAGKHTTDGEPVYRLLADVLMDGLCIEIEPTEVFHQESAVDSDNCEGPSANTTPAATTYFSQYIDSILSSLRLSLQLNNLSVRMASPEDERNEKWIECLIQKAIYSDAMGRSALPDQETNASVSGDTTILHKTLDVTKVSISAGETSWKLLETSTSGLDDDDSCSTIYDKHEMRMPIAAIGESQIQILAIESQDTGQLPSFQSDIRLILSQGTHISLAANAVGLLHGVLSSHMAMRSQRPGCVATGENSDGYPVVDVCEAMDDTPGLDIIKRFARQYEEARSLVDQNIVRGGMLLPSENVDDCDGDGICFDAFFDANETGIGHFTSVLASTLVSGHGTLLENCDNVKTRIQVSVVEGSIRLVFNSADGSIMKKRYEEYLLMTYSELNFVASLSPSKTNVDLSLNRFDVDDSQIPIGGLGIDESAQSNAKMVSISHALKFRAGGDSVLEAPCLVLSAQAGKSSSTEIELTLEPFEILCNPKTIANFVQFVKTSAKHFTSLNGDCANMGDSVTQNEKRLSVSVALSSVSLVLPISNDVMNESSPLFRRCGYLSDALLSSPAVLGFVVHGAVLDTHTDENEPMLAFSARELCAFAAAALANATRGSRRFDFLCLGTPDNVSLMAPMSLKLWLEDSGEMNWSSLCSKAFPQTPAITSFKARQDDDDEDNRIERGLYPEIEGIDVVTKSDLKGVDLQSDMIHNASTSNVLLDFYVPECVLDIATSELLSLLTALEAAYASVDLTMASDPTIQENQTVDGKQIAVALKCDFASIILHTEEMDLTVNERENFSIILNATKIRGHYLQGHNHFEHLRLLAEEVDVLDMKSSGSNSKKEEAKNANFTSLFGRTCRPNLSSGTLIEPVIHRSHLFQPISRQSPAMLLDLVNQSEQKSYPEQLNVYLTIYDSTIRCSADLAFLNRLLKFAGKLSPKHKIESTSNQMALFRVFLSCADCNIDYTSPSSFATPSRMILRVGDLRISSNVIVPKPAKQAINISLADVALYICKERHSYVFENSKIPRASLYFRPHQIDLSSVPFSVDTLSTDALVAMDCITSVTLDSFDAVIALANGFPQNSAVDPSIQTSITAGELSVYACKDSFARLIAILSEILNEVTALDKTSLEGLRHLRYTKLEEEVQEQQHPNLAEKTFGVLRTVSEFDEDFLLDGYDWTTIDHDEAWLDKQGEQSARWYGEEIGSTSGSLSVESRLLTVDPRLPTLGKGPRILSNHFSCKCLPDLLHETTDTGINKLVGPNANPQIKNQIMIHDLNVKVRLFDGYDWPDLLNARQRLTGCKGCFIIDDNFELTPAKGLQFEERVSQDMTASCDVKSRLLVELLENANNDVSKLFKAVPLPEERVAYLREHADRHRLSRKTAKYVQVVLSGLSIRLDSLERAENHRLASSMKMSVRDFFIAETIGGDRPTKMAGEWISDIEHPRETTEGMFSMKLVSWFPKARLTPDNKILSDECEAIVKILPLKCILDQRAIRFIQLFARQDSASEPVERTEDRYWFPPPKFLSFRFKPCKLKVDYRPEKIDTEALRNGAIVELVNLTPIDSMVLTLQQVDLSNIIGFGEILSLAARHWIDDVCSTQLLKFLTNSRPLEPFKTVSKGAGDLVVLPWEAIQNGQSFKKALRAGVQSFSTALVYEAFTVTSRTAEFIAEQMSKISASGIGGNALPSRPLKTPRGILDTAPHVVESITRGLQAANYKILVVPYHEYHRTGAKGALTSVLKGIPVAIVAPASGAVEAISYGILGARNQLSREIRKEDEASQRGLHFEA